MGVFNARSEQIWDGVDFTTRFSEIYLQILVPIAIIIVSGSLLVTSLRSILRRFLRRSRSRQLSLNSGGLIYPNANQSIADDGEENPIYRLNTTDASAEYSEVSESLVSRLDIDNPLAPSQPTVSADINNDVEIAFLRPKGVRTRAAIEQVILLGLFVLNIVIFVLLVFYHPREEGSHLSIAALAHSALWVSG
ncbi:hypothetical protein V1514DRAFT_14680 [Lipomyces japonicus]|uniref:uncharacterized protein n=1 Tax=Lipomyces japonicus TaxID=56871 RepID=UPI0034CE162F